MPNTCREDHLVTPNLQLSYSTEGMTGIRANLGPQNWTYNVAIFLHALEHSPTGPATLPTLRTRIPPADPLLRDLAYPVEIDASCRGIYYTN